jgi:hypothetical protein
MVTNKVQRDEHDRQDQATTRSQSDAMAYPKAASDLGLVVSL